MIKFNNFLEATLYFNTEKKCREYLENIRWEGKPYCPHCDHSEKIYKFKDEKTYKCSACKKKFTVTVGSVFENSNVSLQKWLLSLYLVSSTKKGISSIQLGKAIGVTQKTAWFMLQRIREMLKEEAESMLEGVVEIDETYVGGKAKNKHAKARRELRKNGTGYMNMTPVVGMLQRGGKIRMIALKHVHKINGSVLKPLVYDNVAKDSVLITDGHGGYYGLKNTYKQHEVVRHDQGEYVRGMYHTNTIEGAWSHLKRTILGTYHYVSVKHLDRYCNESSFRYNNRKKHECLRFDTALENCKGRLKYKELIK
ncbi:MAG: family transposase [Bacteroidetes bacterium]|nr:family transposase [Bacteroidota bacterium]